MFNTIKKRLGDPKVDIGLSIVVALYNEQDSVAELLEQLVLLAERVEAMGEQVEIILIDDCSDDYTPELIKSYIFESEKNIKLVQLVFNVGQVMALSAGMSVSQGKNVFVTDGDLQFPIQDCTRLLEKAYLGSDLVCSVREKKKNGWRRAFLSIVFGGILRVGFSYPLSEVGCNFRLVGRPVIERCRERDGFVRFSIMNFAQKAKNIEQIYIVIKNRQHGHSSFNFRRLSQFYLDLIIDSEALVVNGLIVSFLLFLIMLLFYISNSVFGLFESSFMTAPAQMFVFMFLSVLAHLSVYSVQRRSVYILGIGVPKIKRVVLKKGSLEFE